jgi:thiosulfate dehydrogenase
LRRFLAGFVIAIIAIGAAVYFYFATGSAPVATADRPMLFEAKLAKAALHARIDKEMPRTVPLTADEPTLQAGAQIYREHCAVCHGSPEAPQTAIAKGMFPKPPRLFHGEGVTDDPPGETYWKVANGIRLTGMPSFAQDLSEMQMWQVSLLLANADKLPDSVRQELSAPPAPATTVTPSATGQGPKTPPKPPNTPNPH